MLRRLAGCFLIAACSNGTEPGAEPALVVLPAADTIRADSTVQFKAVQISSSGDTLEVPSAVWSSRDPDVARVSPTGEVTGVRSGQVTIVALAGDQSGTSEVRVERRFHARAVSTGGAGICAVDLDGVLWCQGAWGAGLAFPSIDSSDIRTFQVPVSGGERYTLVGSNEFFGCGLTTARQALCWGYRPLGDSLSAGIPTAIAPQLTFDTLSVQGWMGCGLAEQTTYCWGLPMDGVKPVDTGGIQLVRLDVQEYDACGWTGEGAQVCWDNYYTGAYPDDREIVQPSAPGVPVLHGLVSGGDYFCGLDPAGLAWCWGVNGEGQLGNGTNVDSPSPVPVAGGRHFTVLSAPLGGGRRVCGIAEDNELFCWGRGFGTVPEAVLH